MSKEVKECVHKLLFIPAKKGRAAKKNIEQRETAWSDDENKMAIQNFKSGSLANIAQSSR